jgi:hypothetical protein
MLFRPNQPPADWGTCACRADMRDPEARLRQVPELGAGRLGALSQHILLVVAVKMGLVCLPAELGEGARSSRRSCDTTAYLRRNGPQLPTKSPNIGRSNSAKGHYGVPFKLFWNVWWWSSTCKRGTPSLARRASEGARERKRHFPRLRVGLVWRFKTASSARCSLESSSAAPVQSYLVDERTHCLAVAGR